MKDLTYKISKYPSTRRLSDGDVDGEIRKALDVWSKHTGREQAAALSDSVNTECCGYEYCICILDS